MATKSDFAQKLLSDLRQRKERMAAAQSSSRQSGQTSGVTRGSSGQATRGGRQLNLPESTRKTSTSSYTGNSNSHSSSRSSSQIVLYDGSRQSSRQVRDLQMAIAFAFENSGNLTTNGSNPLVDFFNRFSRKSQKMETTSFYNHRSAGQVPTVSHIHISEISKGVHKLNQILTTCSNGLNLDRNSIEIGRELLKGAINLEESLRMLVNLQDYSQYYNNGSQKKSRLKLLDEEDDEEEDEHEKKLEQWKLDRPRFSFDKTSTGTRQKQLALQQPMSSLKLVPHRSYVQDLNLPSKPKKEKGRISNVVAKLMGLEEIPEREGNEVLIRENKKLNTATSARTTRETTKKQTSHGNGVKSFDHSMRKQNHGEDKQSKNVERDGKMLQKSSNMIKVEDVSTNLAEKRSVNNHVARNQEHGPKRGDNSGEKKSFAEQKPQQVQRQNPVARNHESRHANPPKSKRSAAMNVQKKPVDERSIKPKVKDSPNRRNGDVSVAVDNLQKTASNQESPKIESYSQYSSKTESEPQIDVEKEEKPTEVAAIQKKTVTKRVQRREIPEKMEVLMTKRNATGNHLKKSTRKPANMLKDLKQQIQSKNRGSRRMGEESGSKAKEGKVATTAYTASEMATNELKEQLEAKDEFQEHNIQNTINLRNNSDSIVSSRDVLNDLEMEEEPSVLKDEEQLKKCDPSIEIHEEDLPQLGYMAMNKQEQLTEPEKNLKETVIKSQLFLSSAEALFKLNIPVSFLHAGEHHEHEGKDKKLILDSAYEALKTKARRYEITHHPFMKTTMSSTKPRSLDDLVRLLCKDLETLKSYGMSGSDEGDVAAGLHRMLNRDIYNEDPDVNCMWDLEWSRMRSIFPEMEGIVKDVETYMLNGLVEEIARDLLIITVFV